MVLFIDSFLFNGEEIVKMRLEYLYNYVDYFYIVESIYTFSGIQKKEFYLDKHAEWFQPYLDKIKFIKINSLFDISPYTFRDENERCFYEERQQRNYIRKVLLKDFIKKDFILALCDADEFYDISNLEPKQELFTLLQDKYLLLKMKMYMYNFEYYIDDKWEMAFFISSTLLQLHEDLDAVRIYKLGEKTLRRENGWHFTNFMKPIDIVRKLNSFSHADLNRPPYNNIDYVNFTKEKGIDLLNRKDVNIKNIEFSDKFHNYPELFQKYRYTI